MSNQVCGINFRRSTQPHFRNRAIRNMIKAAIIGWTATLLFAVGCEYRQPLATEHSIAIDPNVLGHWEPLPGQKKEGKWDDQILILKYSDTEYLVCYTLLDNGKRVTGYFRAYSMEISGVPSVQLQYLGANELESNATLLSHIRGDSDERQDRVIEVDKHPKVFGVVRYDLKSDTLKISVLNKDLVDGGLTTTEELTKAFVEHKDDRHLFVNPRRYRRITASSNRSASSAKRKIPSVGAKALDDLEAKLKADPQYLMRLLAEDRDQAEAFIRAGQKQRPTTHPWAADVQGLFAGDVFTGKSLQGKDKVAHFKHALAYLQESYDIAVQTLEDAHDEELHAALPGLRLDLTLAALEASQFDTAKKHAAETLRDNADQTNWNYGNIIHDANQILGRCALREGKLADAKAYLLKAGATPGSPQLNSFGPQMQLARELLEKGEKEAVLQYLDLVARFWANPNERTEANSKSIAREHLNQLEAWKRQVRAGKAPDHTKWQ